MSEERKKEKKLTETSITTIKVTPKMKENMEVIKRIQAEDQGIDLNNSGVIALALSVYREQLER